MKCPKCGAQQQDGRAECSSCGIIFSRWQLKTLERRVTQSAPIEEPSRPPWALIAIGVTFFVIFGLMWTKHIKESRAKNDTDLLNDINNKGAAIRADRSGASRAQVLGQEQPAFAHKSSSLDYPPDLTESAVRDMIGQCSFFRQSTTFDIPRAFHQEEYSDLSNRYPALPIAKQQNLISFEQPAMPGEPTTVKIMPIAYSTVEVWDSGGDLIQLGVGKRRLDGVVVAQKSDTKVTINFSFTYEKSGGAALDGNLPRNGTIVLQRDGQGWHPMQGALLKSRAASITICP